MNNKRSFFKEAIKNIKTSGSLVPSSRHLIKTILEDVDFNTAKVIVEFGPGNGIITHQILKKLNKNAVLICFEVNLQFYEHLKQIDDDRLVVLNASAEEIKTELLKLNITTIDYCVSSLPLTNIPNVIAKNILINTKEILKNGGGFHQYQYTLSFFKKIKNIFDKENVKIKFEALNFPPAFVYKCKKI